MYWPAERGQEPGSATVEVDGEADATCARTEVVGVDPVGSVLERGVDLVVERLARRDTALGDADGS